MTYFCAHFKRHLVLVLNLGLLACQKAKISEPIIGRHEIKIEISKSDNLNMNSSLIPSLSRHWGNLLASDHLSIGLKVETLHAPVKLLWITTCVAKDKKIVQQGSLPLPAEIRASELLPQEFFFDPQDSYPIDIPCSFNFTAKQDLTGAVHTFTYETPIYLDHSGQIIIQDLITKQPIDDLAEFAIITKEYFTKAMIQFPLEQILELSCTRFRSPLTVEQNNALVVGRPLWIHEKAQTTNPLQEFPLQICRFIGKKEGRISSWSPYFVLRSEPEKLEFTWSSSQEFDRYSLELPLPAIDLGNLNIKNTHGYPQLVAIPKATEFDVLPLCFTSVQARPGSLIRMAQGEVSPQSNANYRLIAEEGDAWILEILPQKSIRVIYRSTVNLECRCPIVSGATFSAAIAYGHLDHREGGYYFRHRNGNSPSVKVMVENPIKTNFFIPFSTWTRETPLPLTWIIAMRAPKISDYSERIGNDTMLGWPIISSICR